MPFLKMLVHLIFSTKNREKIITKEIKQKLISHIRVNAKEKGIWIDTINCTKDHMHILISLGSEQTISKVAMLIKGESSHWINKNKILKSKFEWQDEYIAISVSPSIIDKLQKYISNQEERHRVKSFSEEYDEFMNKCGFKYLG